jgi:nucleoside-diphosphate-sugar epimerase
MSRQTTLPKGSWILVTGATGFIASHIILQFLKLGYKVRGTVRDLSKAKWLTEDLFASEAVSGSFEIVAVPEISAENAFDEAIRGMEAVAHVASVITYDRDPKNVIPQSVAGAVNALKAAKKEKSVLQFVITSSVGAAASPAADTEFHVDANSWNDAVVTAAWAPPPYEPSRGMITYLASKVEAEKAVWRFVEEEKPHFTVNAVNPFTTLGRVLNENQLIANPGTVGWVREIYRGQVSSFMDLGVTACEYACKLPCTDQCDS